MPRRWPTTISHTPAGKARTFVIGRQPGYAGHKPDHSVRLARIEGQVRGVTRMVQGDRYRTDVLTQISAVTRALQEVAFGLVDDHLRHRVIDAARADPDDGTQKAAELAIALRVWSGADDGIGSTSEAASSGAAADAGRSAASTGC